VDHAPRLLAIAPSREHGGAESYLLRIAQAAVGAGWEVHAAVPGPPEGREVWDAFEQPGVVRHTLPVGRGHGPGGLAAARRLLGDFLMTAAAILRVRPDVVFINLPTPEQSPGAMLATAVLRRPTAVVFHLVPPGPEVTHRRQRLYALAGRRQIWITVSDDSRRELARRLGRPVDRILRIYNGIELLPRATRPAPDRAEIRHELGIPAGRTVLLTVARLSLQKGHDLILDAMPDLLARDPGVVLVWAGAGEEQSRLASRIREMGLDDHVRMLGPRGDVDRLLAVADLFLFPSLFEGFGFALAEAMAAEVPVLTVNSGVMRELVHDREHGLLFAPGDPRDLAEHVRWAIEHPEEMRRMAAAARRRVADTFLDENMLRGTLAVLDDLGRVRP
jgi:glycosyltransferase involved in cell wall biosynthesis